MDQDEKDILLAKLDRSVNTERYIPDPCELFSESTMISAQMRSYSRPSPEEIPEGFAPSFYFAKQLIAYDMYEFCKPIELANSLWLLADSEEKRYDGDVLLTDPLSLKTDRIDDRDCVLQNKIEKLIKTELTHPYSIDYYPDYEPKTYYSRQFDRENATFLRKLQVEQRAIKANDLWEQCASEGNLSPVGISDAVMRHKLHGDIAFAIHRANAKTESGYIGTDSGTIAFMPLDSAKKAVDIVNLLPNSVVLKDFHGTLRFVVKQERSGCDDLMDEAFWRQFRLYIEGMEQVFNIRKGGNA